MLHFISVMNTVSIYSLVYEQRHTEREREGERDGYDLNVLFTQEREKCNLWNVQERFRGVSVKLCLKMADISSKNFQRFKTVVPDSFSRPLNTLMLHHS